VFSHRVWLDEAQAMEAAERSTSVPCRIRLIAVAVLAGNILLLVRCLSLCQKKLLQWRHIIAGQLLVGSTVAGPVHCM